MTAIEDPAAQLGSEAAAPHQASDDLENWLSDLRTDPAADPTGWADETDDPPPAPERAPEAPQPSSGGRHRAPE